MPRNRYSLFAIALLVTIALAQGPSPSTNAIPPTVSLIISARAKDDRVELTPAELEIKEDGKPVQIQQVRKLDLPLRYCVLFDVSGSGHLQFKRQQTVAMHLLATIARPRIDVGWVNLFSVGSLEGQETGNPDDILNAIARSRSYGPTALYDAVGQCAARMEKGSGDARLRVMFLFSDGDDNQSHISMDQAIHAAISAGLRIYVLATEYESRPNRGERVLKKFTGATGGELFSPIDVEAVKKAESDIKKDLGNMFEVSYESQAGSDHRNFHIKCLKKGVTLHAPEVMKPAQP